MKIIGYHIEKDFIVNSDKEICVRQGDILDDELASFFLNFLLQPKGDCIRVLWNLNYSVAQLLRAMKVGANSGVKLVESRKLKLSPENYELGYLTGKFLGVKHLTSPIQFVSFADMYQYHKEEISEAENIPDAIAKAIKAREEGIKVYEALRKVHCSATTLTSPIRAWEIANMEKLDLPTVDDTDDISSEIGEWAYDCCHGGWFESFERGYWDEAFDYDISSAYPFQLSKLPDTREGEWIELDRMIPEASLGFLEGIVTITSDFSPIIFEVDEDHKYTPKGTWPTILTLDEVRFIEKHKLGSFKLEKGWFWYSKSPITKPLYYVIKELYAAKEASNGFKREIIKRIPNGIYGKLLALDDNREDFGKHFNPVWGALVESRTRLEVAEFCLRAIKRGMKPLHIAVDGVILDKKAISYNDTNPVMGTWHFNTQGKCIIVSTGVVGIEGKGSEAQDFSISYDKLCSMILEDPKASSYQMDKVGFISVGRAINEHRWEDLGMVTTVSRSIEIDSESKRYYAKSPKSGSDLLNHQYSSVPWDAEIFEVEEVEV